MRRLQAWDSFWGAFGFLRRNRRQRQAAVSHRRSLRRRHRLDVLEQRVVLNADPVAVDDEYVVGAGSPFQTADYAPALSNDTDGDGDELGLLFDGDPGAQITLNGGDTYSWNYIAGDYHGAFDAGQVRVSAEGTPSRPFVYVENTGLRENGTSHVVNVRLSQANPNEYVVVHWELQSGTAQEGSDYLGVHQDAYSEEVWIDAYTTQEWVESGYYETQWIPNLVNEPILIDDQYDEFGQLIQAGYWQENWVDYGGYQDVYVSTGSWEYHEVEGHWSIVDHDATHITSGALVFAPGEIEKSLNIAVVADGQFESPESFTLHLTSADNADIVGWSDGTITLLDEAAPTPRDDEYTLFMPWDFSGGMVDLSTLSPSLTNDLDFDGDALTLIVNNNPTSAYVMPGDTVGYSYAVADTAGSLSWANVNIHIVNEAAPPISNSAPTANDDYYTVYAPYGSGGTTINWADYVPDLGNDSDPDGDPLSIVGSNNPGDWQWIGSGQTASYTYTVDDGQGGQAAASVTVYVEEEEYSPANSAPTPVDDYYTLTLPFGAGYDWYSLAAFQPDLSNDYDPEGDAIAPYSSDVPDFAYTGPGETLSYSYSIVDGCGNVNSATVYITVTQAANSAPTFTPGADITVDANHGFVVVADWATNLSSGAAEGQQVLTFEVVVDDPAEQALFAELPVIESDGTLWFSTSGVVGTAHVKIRLHDDGGTENGGVDTSAEYTLAIQCYAAATDGGGSGDPSDPTTPVVGFGGPTEVVVVDEDEASGNATFILTLSEAVDHDVEVTWHTVGDTAYEGLDFQSVGGVVTFAAGETSKSIQVPLINDGRERVAERSFQVVLTSAVGADLAEVPVKTGVIQEDDVSVVVSDAVEVEGPVDDYGNVRELVFFVTLSRAAEHDVTVDYTTVGLTADSGDFVDASDSLTFAAGETVKEIRVRLVDDSANWADPMNPNTLRGEPTEYLKVELSSTDPRVTVAAPYGIGTIIDDDWKQWDVLDPNHRTFYQEWYNGADYAAGDTIALDPYSYVLNGDTDLFVVPDYWAGGFFWTSYVDPLYGWVASAAQEASQPTVTVEALDSDPVGETGVANFRIRVTGADNGETVTVNYATHGLTAVSDVDFESVDDGSVTITGNDYVDVAVNILADALTEPLEDLMLYVKSIVGAPLTTAIFAVAQVKQPVVKSVKFLTSAESGDTTGELVRDGNDFTNAATWNYRYFPDAHLGETEGRNVVRVRAVVEGLQEGDRVYFMAYDVDDASRADAGDKTAPQGNDNYGRLNLTLDENNGITDGHHTPGDPDDDGGFAGLMRGVGADGTAHVWHGYEGDPMGSLPLVSGIVRRDFITGEYYAEAELLTSFQPGDNFRVVAMPQPKGGDPNWDIDDGVIPDEITDAFADLHFENSAAGERPQVHGMAASGTLTVWRYLHMEVDQMTDNGGSTNPLGDFDAGTIAENLGMMGSHGWRFLIAVAEDAASLFNKNSLEGGLLRIGDENFEIVGSGAAVDGQVEITIKREVGRQLTAAQFQVGAAVTMYEDDFIRPDDNPDGAPVLRVDMSADLRADALKYMQTSFRADQNKFADAFIMPEYEVLAQYSGELASRNHWEENWTNQDEVNYDGAVDAQNGSRNLGSNIFWTSYLGIGYQYTAARDFDPDLIVNGAKNADGDERNDDGKSVRGITSHDEENPGFKNSFVFVENIWDNWTAHRNLESSDPQYAQSKTADAQLARTSIHEVGHQFFMDHPVNDQDQPILQGIMSAETLLVKEVADPLNNEVGFNFTVRDLLWMRSLVVRPGFAPSSPVDHPHWPGPSA